MPIHQNDQRDLITVTPAPTTAPTPAPRPTPDGERADLLAELAAARSALTQPTHGLTDPQAGTRPTVSALCLGGLIKHVAARSAKIITATPDLSATHPLPEAPWHEPGAVWSVRRVLLHLIAETAQHAGHADLLRETLDGQTST